MPDGVLAVRIRENSNRRAVAYISLNVLEEVRLRGTRCLSCGEVFFGRYVSCENCGAAMCRKSRLGRRGKLYSYTVMRVKPSRNYKGPDPLFLTESGLLNCRKDAVL